VNSRVGTTFGKYNIVRLLGKGGMGEVYEAYDNDKGRTVALKILVDQFSND
jgi:serine/threonine protein kinase